MSQLKVFLLVKTLQVFVQMTYPKAKPSFLSLRLLPLSDKGKEKWRKRHFFCGMEIATARLKNGGVNGGLQKSNSLQGTITFQDTCHSALFFSHTNM